MTIDRNGEFYHIAKVFGFVFNPTKLEAPEYWLGILNSRVLWFLLRILDTLCEVVISPSKPITSVLFL